MFSRVITFVKERFKDVNMSRFKNENVKSDDEIYFLFYKIIQNNKRKHTFSRQFTKQVYIF